MTLYPNWLAIIDHAKNLHTFLLQSHEFFTISRSTPDTIDATFSPYSPPSCQSSNNVALDPNKSACTSIFDSRAREECSRDTWLPGSCGTIIDSWPDRWGSRRETLRDLLQLLLSPSERIGYATKWSGTRIKDSVVFSFEDQGIPTLFHFSSISSIALVTLFSLFSTPPSLFVYHVPREPDVALTLANQLDFATRMRPARLNFKPLHSIQGDSIPPHGVLSVNSRYEPLLAKYSRRGADRPNRVQSVSLIR